MALNIKFKTPPKTEYTYSDLHLDMIKHTAPIGGGNLTRKSGIGDVRTDFDEAAIGNSLRNLFSTKQNQRILLPDYGLDLSMFLFDTANEHTARLIARKITQGIEKYEPRVAIDKINVIVDAEYNRYNVLMSLFLPSLGKNVTYSGIFTENGFTI